MPQCVMQPFRFSPGSQNWRPTKWDQTVLDGTWLSTTKISKTVQPRLGLHLDGLYYATADSNFKRGDPRNGFGKSGISLCAKASQILLRLNSRTSDLVFPVSSSCWIVFSLRASRPEGELSLSLFLAKTDRTCGVERLNTYIDSFCQPSSLAHCFLLGTAAVTENTHEKDAPSHSTNQKRRENTRPMVTKIRQEEEEVNDQGRKCQNGGLAYGCPTPWEIHRPPTSACGGDETRRGSTARMSKRASDFRANRTVPSFPKS